MTPNTTSIMGGVEPGRRGIANGVRSMLQNTGYVVSTAMSLAIVTSPLTPAQKQAAYAGTLSRLSPQALDNFTGGYRTALAVLAGICVLGMILSLARNAGQQRGRSRCRTPILPAGPDLTVFQVQDAVGQVDEVRVVGGDQGGYPLGLHDDPQQAHDLLGRLGVELAGRLVRQQDVGAPGQGPGDRDPLLLAAGQFRRAAAARAG